MMILIVILLLSSASAARLPKCCPLDEVVSVDIYEENFISSSDAFNCVQNVTGNYSSEFSHQKFIGYNTLVDHNSHWPSCGDQALSFKPLTESHKESPSASCVDLMDGKYFIFTCGEKRDTASGNVDVLKLRKCCSAGMSYDIFQRRCVENNVTEVDSDFSELLRNKIVLFEHEVLKCKMSEALVEYHSLVHGLKIRGSQLIITNSRANGPDVIANSRYCIEATSNTEIEMPEGMTEEHFNKKSRSKFIAKTCRDKEICEDIPCLQKCCPHGERMYHNGTLTLCEPHHADIDLKFHSFNKDESHLEPPAIEPSGEQIYLEPRVIL